MPGAPDGGGATSPPIDGVGSSGHSTSGTEETDGAAAPSMAGGSWADKTIVLSQMLAATNVGSWAATNDSGAVAMLLLLPSMKEARGGCNHDHPHVRC